ncbi:hypothetical protein [Nocardioides montaniterrae]
MSADTDALAALIAKHHCDYKISRDLVVTFDCGFVYTFDREEVFTLRNAQDAHLAAVIAAHHRKQLAQAHAAWSANVQASIDGAVRKMQAAAWDEGRDHGDECVSLFVRCIDNPYRKDQEADRG